MGKTSKPLVIIALGECGNWPEVQKLVEQKHDVTVFNPGSTPVGELMNEEDVWRLATKLSQADLVIGPYAHRMSEHERKWLGNAIIEARRRKYPTSKQGDDIEPEEPTE